MSLQYIFWIMFKPPRVSSVRLIVISDFQGLTFSLHLPHHGGRHTHKMPTSTLPPWLPCCAALADPLNYLKHFDLASSSPCVFSLWDDSKETIKPFLSFFSETPSRVVAECTALCASLCEHEGRRKHAWFEGAIKAKCLRTCRLRHVHANHRLRQRLAHMAHCHHLLHACMSRQGRFLNDSWYTHSRVVGQSYGSNGLCWVPTFKMKCFSPLKTHQL